MAKHIQIVEVSPRDGLQADPADLTTDQKVALIERLIAGGHTRIEAASFVDPKAVPKMADGDAVMAKVVQKELDADPGRKGAAVIIDVEKITNLRGDEL